MEDKKIYIFKHIKNREEIEKIFDALKNKLENDKTYLSDDDALRGYFFVSFLSLYLYCRILRMLKEKKLSGKLLVGEVLMELSKAYQVSFGKNKKLSAVPAKAEKIMHLFNIDINPKTMQS